MGSLPHKVTKPVKRVEEVREDLGLYIATLRHAVIHRLNDVRDDAGETAEREMRQRSEWQECDKPKVVVVDLAVSSRNLLRRDE